MSGKAIVIKGVTFPNNRIVHFTNVDETVPVTSISVESEKASMQVGETANLVASVLPIDATNSNVLWTTSSNAIATVSPNGKSCVVTAVAPGTVTITCTSQSNSNIRFTTQIAVTDILVTGITISGQTEIINNGKYTASYTPTNTTQKGIIWSSSNTSIATIDSSGNLTVVSNGAVTITARSSVNSSIYGTFDVSCELAVVHVTGVTLSSVGSPSTLNVNDSLAISALVSPETASNKALIWAVSNANAEIISSNDDGCVVKGLTAGAVAITATSADDGTKVGTYNLTIQFINIQTINITATSETLRVGNAISLSASMLPSNATDKAVAWSINNGNASISANGDSCTVNAVSEGSITVTATAQDGSGVIGTWGTTILPALQVDNTLLVHLESEDYVESSNSWVERKANLTAFVYGSPEKTAAGLVFPNKASTQRFSLDISSIYSGGSFTVYIEGEFTFNSSASPTRYMAGIQAASGDADNGFWLATRGTGVGTVVLTAGGAIKYINKLSYNRAIMTFDATTNQIILYGIDTSSIVFSKSDTLVESSAPLLGAFKTSLVHYLTNGSVINTDPSVVLGSTNNVTNQHTIKRIKMFNVAKTLAEVTAMLTA